MNAPVHIVCSQCQSVVRVASDKLTQSPHCPQCHQALLDGQVIDLSSKTFDKHLQRNDLPLVVDVWAPWCGPCKMMAPRFAQAAIRLRTQLRFARVNSDEETELAGRFRIRSIPTLIVFKQGRELARQSGAMDAGHLLQWLQAVVSSSCSTHQL